MVKYPDSVAKNLRQTLGDSGEEELACWKPWGRKESDTSTTEKQFAVQ